MEVAVIALATLTTFVRVLLIIALSIVSGWLLSYIAIKNRLFENAFVTIISVLESVPVFSFIPIVLILFIEGLGGFWGVEAAADFLVFSAVVWNIWIGIYQAFKTVPEHLLEVSNNYNFGFTKIMRFLYIPFSMPRIAGNIFPSFANALFYITVSEVFTVGAGNYETFGIGSVIAHMTTHGDLVGVYYSLLFLALGVVFMTFVFTKFSNQVVAKYGINTDIEIRRPRKYPLGYGTKLLDIVWNRTRVIPKYTSRMISRMETDRNKKQVNLLPIHHINSNENPAIKMTVKYILLTVTAGGLLFVIYSAAILVISVPNEQWNSYFVLTPYILYSMAVDYGRVLIVTAIALVFAIFLGSYLTSHRKAAPISIPILQTIGAFPTPTYFPLLFAATVPFLQASVGTEGSTELYVLLLSFLSVFYYAIFNFWIGIQVIPSEFWDIIRIYQIPFFSRLRRIILPATFPFMISGISSTINSAWGGLAIAEYWPKISESHNLVVGVGLMKIITSNTASGNIGIAAWTSLLFAIAVIIFGLLFTKKLLDLARKKYVVEEGIYQA